MTEHGLGDVEARQMPTLAEILVPEGYLRTPRIEQPDLRLLWHSDYWDGPRSGMLLLRGEPCWFEVIAESDEDDSTWYRRFAVIRLSPDQLDEEQRWHELFRQNVGGHTDYYEDGKRPISAPKPREQWDKFYEPYKDRTPQDFSSNEVVGWFEDWRS